MPAKRQRPIVLCVIDGFGVAPDGGGNAVTRANTPNFDIFKQRYPVMTLRASGEAVGLSWGEMGNSEVGHLSIGAGRVYYQTLPRINREIAQGHFFENPAFVNAIEHAKANRKSVHLVGLVSGGGVHSLDEHCYALLELCVRRKFKDVYVHAILDGRDTLYNAGIDYVNNLLAKMKELKVGKIASLSGRYYAMDRDKRWDRIEKAYRAMALGQSEETAKDPVAAIEASYQKEVYDEQSVPTVIVKGSQPIATIEEGDAVIFFNFRPDRARQLTKAFTLPSFDKFERAYIRNLYFVTMTEYEKDLPVEVAYPPIVIDQTLAEVVSRSGLKQLHIAETEKYAHVTFFMNGTREEPFAGEERVIIPSPRVASYDEKPAMSAKEITDRVTKDIKDDKFDLIIMNYANPDMVAHTGNLEATIKAVEALDEQIGRLAEATLAADGVLIITSDHGNAEELKNVATDEMSKEHSTNIVPIYIIGRQFEGMVSPAGEIPGGDLSLVRPVGMLADVAPTVLKIMGLSQPETMTGEPLI
ncbi:MAG: 2,3-bisphosphoglycerate-independent phosphoglycerate mutase [Candidatus Uhrbacteria bacterium]|nr:2,3-bisphosphoglycerate-independent phosphoglycerate mutase [Patescibacteria group bacterium]MBU1906684.1 2,3-bisphosphoglycerate-independent phosphoglycerate mutase [Patescibacteria group bacterium]